MHLQLRMQKSDVLSQNPRSRFVIRAPHQKLTQFDFAACDQLWQECRLAYDCFKTVWTLLLNYELNDTWHLWHTFLNIQLGKFSLSLSVSNSKYHSQLERCYLYREVHIMGVYFYYNSSMSKTNYSETKHDEKLKIQNYFKYIFSSMAS